MGFLRTYWWAEVPEELQGREEYVWRLILSHLPKRDRPTFTRSVWRLDALLMDDLPFSRSQ